MQVHGWALRGGLAQQGRLSEGPATACRESEAEATGWVKTQEGAQESSRQKSLQEHTLRSRQSWRREERTKLFLCGWGSSRGGWGRVCLHGAGNIGTGWCA